LLYSYLIPPLSDSPKREMEVVSKPFSVPSSEEENTLLLLPQQHLSHLLLQPHFNKDLLHHVDVEHAHVHTPQEEVVVVQAIIEEAVDKKQPELLRKLLPRLLINLKKRPRRETTKEKLRKLSRRLKIKLKLLRPRKN